MIGRASRLSAPNRCDLARNACSASVIRMWSDFEASLCTMCLQERPAVGRPMPYVKTFGRGENHPAMRARNTGAPDTYSGH